MRLRIYIVHGRDAQCDAPHKVMAMTAYDFDCLLSTLRAAREGNDYSTILTCLVACPDERAEDVAAVYPLAYEVWGMVGMLETEGVHSFAHELERRFGVRARAQELPAGFASVLGGVLHRAFLSAREDGAIHGLALALECGADDQVMVVCDDERLFVGDTDNESGEYTQGLDTLWPDLGAIVWDAEARGGYGAARAYVDGETAAEIGLPGQRLEAVTHPLVDSDGQGTTVYVVPTTSGWVVWVV